MNATMRNLLYISLRPFLHLFNFTFSSVFLLLVTAAMASTIIDAQNDKFVPDEHNVLQKHVVFFDQNQDGVVYPWETFKGFRAIGCGLGLSTVAALFINMGLSHKTRPGKMPSLLFPIEIKNINRAKHGSDSGVYDSQGRFVPEKFEEIFKKHAKSHPNALTEDELMGMLKTNRQPKDYGGWLASYTEWKILYSLGKGKDGLLQKDTVRAVYDGSLFVQMKKEHESAQKKSSVV